MFLIIISILYQRLNNFSFCEWKITNSSFLGKFHCAPTPCSITLCTLSVFLIESVLALSQVGFVYDGSLSSLMTNHCHWRHIIVIEGSSSLKAHQHYQWRLIISDGSLSAMAHHQWWLIISDCSSVHQYYAMSSFFDCNFIPLKVAHHQWLIRRGTSKKGKEWQVIIHCNKESTKVSEPLTQLLCMHAMPCRVSVSAMTFH